MIKLNKDFTDIIILKSNFNYSTQSATYSLNFINDVSMEEYNFNFNLNYSNEMVTNIGLTGASFSMGGFYTLNIYLNDTIEYTERCYILYNTIPNNIIFDDTGDDDKIIFNT